MYDATPLCTEIDEYSGPKQTLEKSRLIPPSLITYKMDKVIKDGILEEDESFGGAFLFLFVWFFVLIQKHSKLLFKMSKPRFLFCLLKFQIHKQIRH